MTTSVEKTEGSIYSPLMEGEITRLALQSRLTRNADMIPVNELKKSFQSKKVVYILDVGCGYGMVARDRFKDWDNIFVVGIDFQEGVLEKARKLNSDVDNFVFEQANIDSVEFDTRLEEIEKKYNIENGFDIVFCAYVVQHISDPIKFLTKCRNHISDDGYIFLRNTADKSTISYGDDGLIKEIQDLSELAPGTASRDLGMQLHHHLYVSGYNNIQVYGWLKNTSNLSVEERMNIFRERFSWRSMYFKTALDKDPDNEELRSKYEWMVNALNRLEEIFKEPAFWYGETILNVVARKQALTITNEYWR